MTQDAMIRTSQGAKLGYRSPIPVVTTLEVPGMRVVKVLGVARGNTVRARHVGLDMIAGLRSLVGGEIPEYTKMVAESREQAIDRMIESALAMGASGIIGMRFETCSIMQSAAELLAYGTAVVLEPIEPG